MSISRRRFIKSMSIAPFTATSMLASPRSEAFFPLLVDILLPFVERWAVEELASAAVSATMGTLARRLISRSAGSLIRGTERSAVRMAKSGRPLTYDERKLAMARIKASYNNITQVKSFVEMLIDNIADQKPQLAQDYYNYQDEIQAVWINDSENGERHSNQVLINFNNKSDFFVHSKVILLIKDKNGDETSDWDIIDEFSIAMPENSSACYFFNINTEEAGYFMQGAKEICVRPKSEKIDITNPQTIFII